MIQAPAETRPTLDSYSVLDEAYEHFNRELFDGTLPRCLITHRKRNSTGSEYGYYSHRRLTNPESPDESRDEIALNLTHFSSTTPKETLSTLVHEMVHCWQYHHGKPSRNVYHNREWGSKMKLIGLHPSSTGEPGGKETGQRVSHWIIEGGPFDQSCNRFLLDHEILRYHDDRPKQSQAKRASKTKFSCPKCKANAWAKASVKLACGECMEIMLP